MSFQFAWTEDLSVGNQVLDREHSRLLEQVNILVNAIAAQNDPAVVQSVIEFLSTYISDHFSHEEKYMMDNNYPETENHIALHRDFANQYEVLKQSILLHGASEDILLDIENKLARWWVEHIGVEDKKYAAFIAIQEKNK